MKQRFSHQAGALAIDAVPTCRVTDSVETVRIYVQNNAHSFATIDYIYVLEDHILEGVFSLHELMSEKASSLVQTFMCTDITTVHVHATKQHVAEVALAHSIKAVPVVDANKKFLGIVTADTIFTILHDNHTNYLLKFAGIQSKSFKNTDERSLFGQVKTRIPWLVLGLLGGVLGAMVVRFFEASVNEMLFVAAFIPAIVYIADAVGNQSEMLVVRALSREQNFSIRRYLVREWTAGFVISVILSALMFGLSFLWLQSLVFSLTLLLAIMATTLFSITFTVLLPWILKKCGFDPAVASGPLATVACDVSSVTIYLLIATALL